VASLFDFEMDANRPEFYYCRDLKIIPLELRPPTLTYRPPVDRPYSTTERKELAYESIQSFISGITLYAGQQFLSQTETEVLERFHQIVAYALNPMDKAKTQMLKDIFYPRSFFARTACSVLGDPANKSIQYVWNSTIHNYEAHVSYEWDIADIKLAQAAFGTFYPVVFGAKDREINFDTTIKKSIVGGWIIPNIHTFSINYNWGTQLLNITFSYYKYEARNNSDGELCLTKLI